MCISVFWLEGYGEGIYSLVGIFEVWIWLVFVGLVGDKKEMKLEYMVKLGE